LRGALRVSGMKSSRLLPLIVAVALFIENMDSTVLSTSLPAIAADLATDPIALKLALTTYLLALAVFIPVSGWVADRFGARATFVSAIGVFLLGSVGCALSDSLAELVAGRFVQGAGGAMMVPVGRLVLLRTIPKSEIVQALSWVTIPALVGPMVGPPLGGFITTYFEWRWIFLINLPIGALGIVLGLRFIPATREQPPPLDWLGFALAGGGLGAAMFGFSTLGQHLVPIELAVAALVLGVGSLPARDLQNRCPRGLVVSRGHRRHPVPSTVDAAARLRPEPRTIGLGDVRLRHGRHLHENRRGTNLEVARLPPRVAVECVARLSAAVLVRFVPSNDTRHRDHGNAFHQRLLPRAAVHELERNQLRRCR
jgi:hypothetical protein